MRNIEIIKSTTNQNSFKMDPMKDSSLVIGLKIDRERLRKKIKERLLDRIKDGMIEEVQNLLDNQISMERLDYFGLEYKFVGKYLRGEIDKDEMITNLTTAIRRFSKRNTHYM